VPRTVVLTVPHFSVVPLGVAETGLVATLSRRLAETYASILDLERTTGRGGAGGW
jgi:predicted amino acid-binding ACT domain protein